MPFIDLEDRRLHYRLDGATGAPVLLLSNSLGTTLDMWQPQLAAFSQHYRVLRYDTRGHGGSTLGSGPCSIAQLGGDVLALLDALDIERVHFCGISMGGLTGQWLGVHAPQRLHKLVLCNTAARIGNQQAWDSRAALVRQDGMAEVAAGAAARWFSADYVALAAEQVATLLRQLAECDAAGYAACCDALATADLRNDIAGITVPTLVIAGLQDPVTTPADADFMASQIKGAQRIDLLASHLSSIEAAAAFNRALAAFLAA